MFVLLVFVWIVDHDCLEMIVRFVDIGVICWPSLFRGVCSFCWYWCELLTITVYYTCTLFLLYKLTVIDSPISPKRLFPRKWTISLSAILHVHISRFFFKFFHLIGLKYFRKLLCFTCHALLLKLLKVSVVMVVELLVKHIFLVYFITL